MVYISKFKDLLKMFTKDEIIVNKVHRDWDRVPKFLINVQMYAGRWNNQYLNISNLTCYRTISLSFIVSCTCSVI